MYNLQGCVSNSGYVWQFPSIINITVAQTLDTISSCLEAPKFPQPDGSVQGSNSHRIFPRVPGLRALAPREAPGFGAPVGLKIFIGAALRMAPAEFKPWFS